MKRGGTAFLLSLALVIGLVFGTIAAVNWWLETRFGANIAILTWGAAGGIICVALGILFTMIVQRSTITGVSDILHDNANVSKAQIGVYREYARSEREAFKERAKLDVLDERRIMKLADQQARLIAQNSQSQAVDEQDDFLSSIQVEYKEVE
jgi:hypothetical protein